MLGIQHSRDFQNLLGRSRQLGSSFESPRARMHMRTRAWEGYIFDSDQFFSTNLDLMN